MYFALLCACAVCGNKKCVVTVVVEREHVTLFLAPRPFPLLPPLSVSAAVQRANSGKGVEESHPSSSQWGECLIQTDKASNMFSSPFKLLCG